MPNFNFQPNLPNNFDPSVPNQINQPGDQERQNNWARSISRSKRIKAAAKTIIATRQDLADYLAQGGLKLLTSSIEFQQTGDFIRSSYVIYTQHNDVSEPLANFLERYDFLKEVAEKINQDLKPTQGQMQVLTK
jgi:hypothetical protein